MAAKALIDEGSRNLSGFVHQQLGLNAMYAGRLLQGFDHVREQARFNLGSVGSAAAIRDKEITDDTLAALIHKERIAVDSAAIDGRRIARLVRGITWR